MTDRIDTLTIRCRGHELSRTQIDAVQSRLRRIASTHLPEALDQLLPNVNLELDTVMAPLTFAVADYDDETIALRWASAIAGAIIRHDPRATVGDSFTGAPIMTADEVIAPESIPNHPLPALVATVDGIRMRIAALPNELRAVALSIVERWLASKSGVPGSSASLAADPTSVADRQFSAAELLAMRQLLRTEDHGTPAATGAGAGPPSDDAAGPQSATKSADVPQRDDAAARRSTTRRDPVDLSNLAKRLAPLSNRSVEELAAELDRVVRAVERSGQTPTAAALQDDQQWSVVGGLVLLYPWIGRLLEHTWSVFGSEPEPAVAVLADVVSFDKAPADLRERLALDPLVKLLVGLDPAFEINTTLVAAVDTTPVAEEVASTRQRFASAVRGSWTMDTLTSGLVWRSALIQDSGDRWTIIPAAGPLDYLLMTLHYPLTSFAFEWTQPIAVRWPHD